jgi:hypothetical protein
VSTVPDTDPPRTTAAQTTAPDTDPPPVTQAPVIRDFVLLCEESASAQALELPSEDGINIIKKVSANAADDVRDAVLTGRSDSYGGLLLTTESAIELFCEGMLQDLSEAGIDIEATGISASAAFDGGVYMLFSPCLSENYLSAYALLCNADAVDDELAKTVLDGDFTVSVMKKAASRLEAKADARAVCALYFGAGGSLFGFGDGGAPAVSFGSDADKAAYLAAGELFGIFSEDESDFRLEKLGKAESGKIYLPLPKESSAQREYVTPIDEGGALVLAAPDGITNGAFTAEVFSALSSLDKKDAARGIIASSGVAVDIARIILDSVKLDVAELYGWGDLGDYLFECIKGGISFSDAMSAASLAERREAVDTAALIIKGRLEE